MIDDKIIFFLCSAANAFYAGSLLPKESDVKFLTDLVEVIKYLIMFWH